MDYNLFMYNMQVFYQIYIQKHDSIFNTSILTITNVISRR